MPAAGWVCWLPLFIPGWLRRLARVPHTAGGLRNWNGSLSTLKTVRVGEEAGGPYLIPGGALVLISVVAFMT